MLVCLVRKPQRDTIDSGLAINLSRVPLSSECSADKVQKQQHSSGTINGAFGASALIGREIPTYNQEGRFPANVILVGSWEDRFPTLKSATGKPILRNAPPQFQGGWSGGTVGQSYTEPEGSATRYFRKFDPATDPERGLVR